MWKDNRFYYSVRILRAIAESYSCIYEGLPLSYRKTVRNPWSIAEYKADFDMALSSLGQKWRGIESLDIGDYKGYSQLQQAVIGDILNISDREMEVRGFKRWMKGYAYYLMMKELNT